MTTTLKRFLRSPRVIVGEILLIALLCALGASLPQAGSATETELARWQNGGLIVAGLVRAFSLDRVFSSPLFCGATLLAAASLCLVSFEQLRRLRVAWKAELRHDHFNSAPFQFEFERPANPGRTEAGVRLWTEHRAGMAGSMLLHIGLLFVMCASALRALFGVQAVADLIEGETLPPSAAGWSAQWPGLLARPMQLANPVTLERVEARFYEAGELRELTAHLTISGKDGARMEQVAVNRDLRLPGGRIYLASDLGPAALVEWGQPNATPTREAVLLKDKGKRSYAGTSRGPNGLRAYWRAELDRGGTQPALTEVRIMKGSALVLTAVARVGEILALPNGQTLSLRGMPFWTRLRGGRDGSLWLVYSGFVLVLSGAILVFALIRVDGCLVITPLGERERVFVALKPQRFAPMFQDRFQRLIRRHGGPEVMVPMARVPEAARAGAPKRLGCEANCRRCVRRALAGCPLESAAPSSAVLGLVMLVGLVGVTSCSRPTLAQARTLVERYNSVVAEAYRRGDVKLIDPVVGPNEGKKITGLIGVRLDLGLTLDSHLLSLEILSQDRRGAEWRVRTRERWRYRDLKIGSGEQVGEESFDSYEMLYVFKKVDQAWLVDAIEFAAPPQVGRKTTTWAAQRTTSHDDAGDNGKEPQP